MARHKFNGGIFIKNPYPIDKIKIVPAPLPSKVVLPLQQRIGEEAKPCVRVGERVFTGQIIAKTEDDFCVPIHASISGTVVAIDKQLTPHHSGLKSGCITIESDGKDEWIDTNFGINFLRSSKKTLIEHIQKSGIVGLGGAGFPTHTKLNNLKNCHTLIINGTECEPGISCDDALMQNYPQEVMRGIEILLHICGAKHVIIAIEDDKQVAFEALLKYLHNDKIKLQKIPTKYTSGAEKLLIKALLNIEIPSNSFAVEQGVLCQNVATTKAIFDAVELGRPLVSRIVTVTGSAVETVDNYTVRLGASFAHIVNLSKPNTNLHSVRMGGMMMGVDVDNLETMICKITNCIFVNNRQKPIKTQGCIRCGQCNLVCPVNLLPQQLYWYAKNENIDKSLDYNLLDCIECRCCDYVCPSHISLAAYFVFTKALHANKVKEQNKVNIARERFEYRKYRLARNKKEHAEMMAAKKAQLKQKMADDKTQKDKIAAAIERVKKNTKNNDDTSI